VVTRWFPRDSLRYDSLNAHFIYPYPPEPYALEHRIVYTSPIRRNVWHGVGARMDDCQEILYSILPVDYSNNPDEEHRDEAWSEWIHVTYPGFADIEESAGASGIPFSLEVAQPAIKRYFTKLKYSIPIDTPIALNLFDASGRRVKSIFNGLEKAGSYEERVIFTDDTGRSLSDGIYFIKYSSMDKTLSEKIIVVK